MTKKPYIKPVILKLNIDNSISLVMMTNPPHDPNPRGSGKGNGKKAYDATPFKNPFGDKPFG